MIRVLDMKPTGQHADGSPIYNFSSGFPSRGVRMVGDTFPDKENAYEAGRAVLDKYCACDPYGNMGSLLGVAQVEGGYRGVIVTYHSNT